MASGGTKSAFYKGVFERMEESWLLFCGEKVVECVVIVDRKRHFWMVLKVRHELKLNLRLGLGLGLPLGRPGPT
jgi:hypothetical protein